MIFDDYRFKDCKAAIRAFISLVRKKVTIMDIAGQVFLRRRTD